MIFSVVTNNPERWEVIFWYKHVPFTWNFRRYKNGKVIERSACLNTANIESLRKINKDLISREIAQSIISLRKKIGKIQSEKDLKEIKKITKEQIDWLARYSSI